MRNFIQKPPQSLVVGLVTSDFPHPATSKAQRKLHATPQGDGLRVQRFRVSTRSFAAGRARLRGVFLDSREGVPISQHVPKDAAAFIHVHTYTYINIYVFIYVYMYMVTPQDPRTFVLTLNLQCFPVFCDNQILVMATR